MSYENRHSDADKQGTPVKTGSGKFCERCSSAGQIQVRLVKTVRSIFQVGLQVRNIKIDFHHQLDSDWAYSIWLSKLLYGPYLKGQFFMWVNFKGLIETSKRCLSWEISSGCVTHVEIEQPSPKVFSLPLLCPINFTSTFWFRTPCTIALALRISIIMGGTTPCRSFLKRTYDSKQSWKLKGVV